MRGFFVLLVVLQVPAWVGAQRSTLSPTLDVWPVGASLQEVVIPRYDEAKKLAAVLHADHLKVIEQGVLRGTKVRLRMLRPSEDVRFQEVEITMPKATYDQSKGLLKSPNTLVARNENFYIRGTRGIFLLPQREGFLYGPLVCLFKNEPAPQSMNHRDRSPSAHSLMVLFAAVLPHASAPLLAEVRAGRDTSDIPKALPEKMTLQEEYAIQLRAQPTKYFLEARNHQTLRHLERKERESRRIDRHLEAFVQAVQSPPLTNLVAQLQADSPGEERPTEKPAVQQGELPDFGPDTTNIQCQGGWYFNAAKGHLVFLKDVVVTDPRFTLTCTKELKAFFEQKASGGKGEKEGGGAAKNPGGLGELEDLLATGDVEFKGKTEEGTEVIARAALAIYNVRERTITLRGGTPYLQYGQQGAIVSEKKDSFIKAVIAEDGSITATSGGTGWKGVLKDLNRQ